MKIDICKQVYDDCKKGSIRASVGVFLSKWVPWMFAEIKAKDREIGRLKTIIKDIDQKKSNPAGEL